MDTCDSCPLSPRTREAKQLLWVPPETRRIRAGGAQREDVASEGEGRYSTWRRESAHACFICISCRAVFDKGLAFLLCPEPNRHRCSRNRNPLQTGSGARARSPRSSPETSGGWDMPGTGPSPRGLSPHWRTQAGASDTRLGLKKDATP